MTKLSGGDFGFMRKEEENKRPDTLLAKAFPEQEIRKMVQLLEEGYGVAAFNVMTTKEEGQEDDPALEVKNAKISTYQTVLTKSGTSPQVFQFDMTLPFYTGQKGRMLKDSALDQNLGQDPEKDVSEMDFTTKVHEYLKGMLKRLEKYPQMTVKEFIDLYDKGR